MAASLAVAEPAIPTTFAHLASPEVIESTAAALAERGFDVRIVEDGDEAKALVLGLIPDGAEVHQASSTTLDVIGVTEAIATADRFEALRPRIWSMDRDTQRREIRKLSAAPDVMLGSVHAVTQSGSLLTATFSGSQLGPYASGAGRVILVAGAQKIVPDIESGLRRIDEHALPLEDARARAAYGMGSAVNGVLILNGQIDPARVTVVLVREALGF